MSSSGMALMMKSLGFDTDKLSADVAAFMAGMKAQAETINANQLRIESKLDAIETKLEVVLSVIDARADAPSTTPVLEDGKPTGVLITSEKFPQAMIDDVNSGGRQQ